MDIIKTIKERHSVRTFIPEPIADDAFASLESMCAQADCPFGGDSKLYLRRFDLKGASSPGTYGTISGCSSYFLVASANDTLSVLSAGFKMEGIVLAATAMGLGTCWLGGTFRHSDFDVEQLPAGMELKAIVAVGYPTGKKRLRDKLTSLISRSVSRKPFGDMFFCDDFSHSMPESDPYAESLQMMRLAPSSVNSQPWRALAIGNVISFYCKGLSTWHLLDCGIGLAHFYASLTASGRTGRFIALSEPPVSPSDLSYLISFK